MLISWVIRDGKRENEVMKWALAVASFSLEIVEEIECLQRYAFSIDWAVQLVNGESHLDILSSIFLVVFISQYNAVLELYTKVKHPLKEVFVSYDTIWYCSTRSHVSAKLTPCLELLGVKMGNKGSGFVGLWDIGVCEKEDKMLWNWDLCCCWSGSEWESWIEVKADACNAAM
jgi:hypothetical protein